MSVNWDEAERGLTPDEWATVFAAGAHAARTTGGLDNALAAMARECENVERVRSSRHS